MTNSTKAWLVKCDCVERKGYHYARDEYTAIRTLWISDVGDDFEDMPLQWQVDMVSTTTATRCYHLDGKITIDEE